MKKYRFQDPKLLTPWQRNSRYVFMFIGWNFLAYAVWSIAANSAEKKNPNFKNLSDAEKILTVTGHNLSEVNRSRVTLVGVEKNGDIK